MKEIAVENYLAKRVKEIGGEVRKVVWPGRRGAPDRCVMMPDRARFGVPQRTTYWVELKRPGLGATFPNNAHERQQAREHVRMRACGQSVSVIDTKEGVDLFVESIQ